MPKTRVSNNNKIWRILILLSCITIQQSIAADTLTFDSAIVKIALKPYSRLYIDALGKLNIEDILDSKVVFSDYFDIYQNSKYPQTYWLHLAVYASRDFRGNIFMHGDSALESLYSVDQMDLFVVDSNQQIRQHERSGYLVPKSQKNLDNHYFLSAVPISFEAGDQMDLYIRLQNLHKPTIRLNLNLELRHISASLPMPSYPDRWHTLGLWGMFIIIGLYVLVLFYFLREKAFLYFGIFCLLYSHNILSIEPTGGIIHFIPEYPHLHELLFVLSLFSISFLLLFGNAFINIKQQFPRWSTYYWLVLGLIILCTLYYLQQNLSAPYDIYHEGILICILLLIPVCIRLVLSKNWKAKVFALGIFSFFGGNALGVVALMFGKVWAPLLWIIGDMGLLLIFAVSLGYRLLEVEREKATADKIRELDQLKSRFFTNISHEFRTPLSMILGPLQQAEESVPQSELAEAQNEIPVKAGHIQRMKRNALRLRQLIDQILDLSKIESGKMRLYLRQGEIVRFIRSRISEFTDIAAAKNIHLITTYGAENEQACFDPDKVEKILNNILSNAIKFTPSQGEIHVKVDPSHPFLQVSVEDSGQGMSESDIHHIFDRFYQSDHAVHQGSGVGMALVKELIELHRGQITVESQEGEGTTIRWKVCIDKDQFQASDFQQANPVSPASTVYPELFAPAAPATSSKIDEQAKEQLPLILLVEDNLDLQQYIKEVLQNDYCILTANDGLKGKDVAVAQLPDLIISDIMMPGLSGIELSTFLKEEEKTSHIPIILLTAKTEQQDRLAGLQTGADAYLHKPFSTQELSIKVANLIQNRTKLKEKYSKQPWKLVESNISSIEEQFLQKVTQTIKQNLSNEYYSVEELGEALGYSRSQLFRKLKAITSKSPLELIKLYRMNYAKELLEKKAVTVSEAAYEVGYSNVSYFSQSFKKEFGKLPSEI